MFYPDFIGSNENYNKLRMNLSCNDAFNYCPWCKSCKLFCTSKYRYKNKITCDGTGYIRKCLNCKKIYTYVRNGYDYLDIHKKTGLPFSFNVEVGDKLIEYNGTIDTIIKLKPLRRWYLTI